MKKLLIVSLTVLVSSVTFAEEFDGSGKPSGSVGNIFRTNDVEWTRRGSMGTKDYVITDIDQKHNLKRGSQTFGSKDLDRTSDYTKLPDNIWDTIETEYNEISGKLIIKIPAKKGITNDVYIGSNKIYVGSSMLFSDYGYDYITIFNNTDLHSFGYRSLNPYCYMSNLPFCYGTNRVDETKVDMLELPRGGKSETIQNDHLIFSDRAWVTNLLIKAGIKTDAEIKTILESM